MFGVMAAVIAVLCLAVVVLVFLLDRMISHYLRILQRTNLGLSGTPDKGDGKTRVISPYRKNSGGEVG